MATMEQRIEAGVAFLDGEFGKMWVHAIDLDRLNLGDGHRCVLGQLYANEARVSIAGGYFVAIDEFGMSDWRSDHLAFTQYRGTFEGLTRRWVQKLRQLQTERPRRRYSHRLARLLWRTA